MAVGVDQDGYVHGGQLAAASDRLDIDATPILGAGWQQRFQREIEEADVLWKRGGTDPNSGAERDQARERWLSSEVRRAQQEESRLESQLEGVQQ